MDWLNPFAGKSSVFDWFVSLLASNAITKGAPVGIAFFFLWHLPGSDRTRNRSRLLALLVATFVSIIVGRAAAMLLPYRPRPLHAESVDLQLPISVDPKVLDGWSSFPSDHAVLYATLVAGFWLVNRWAGLVMALHAFVVIAFARVYLIYHYPTDIVGGAVIGAIIGLALVPLLGRVLARSGIVEAMESHPQYSYPLLFLFLMQIATMFNSARELAKALVSLVT
ncbi:phosphatase PAP2 family protein [Paracoccus beibuensis]|uniref:phosphatase PAP2 family protein n=1 Tax=Paracoccus beibuensis TaxID=547602 RepID=UPI00223EC85A|nr:phosphatase PAP2 family protein [Paracoccus beibuensis]